MLCAGYRVQFAVCNVSGTVCRVQCKWYSLPCTVYRLQFAVCNVNGTVCRVQCAGYSFAVCIVKGKA